MDGVFKDWTSCKRFLLLCTSVIYRLCLRKLKYLNINGYVEKQLFLKPTKESCKFDI